MVTLPGERLLTNAEGFEIPRKSSSPRRDRYVYLLLGVLQLVAAAVIAKQLKDLGILPAWVNTDVTTFFKYLPRNPLFAVPCGHYHNRNVLLVSENVVFPKRVGPGALHMKRSRIYKVYEGSISTHTHISEAARTVDHLGGKVVDVGSLVVSPGVIDVHAHLNEPGRRDWEGISHGTKAAAAGGVTTLVDMPLNCKPAMTTAELMHKKLRTVWSRSKVQMALWGGMTPANANDSKELNRMLKIGAVGFKAFMCPSGINDFPHVSGSHIIAALPILMQHQKPLMLHAEVMSDIRKTCESKCDSRSHATWEASRPQSFEIDAAKVIVHALQTVRQDMPDLWANATRAGANATLADVPAGFKVHIAHLSSAAALQIYQEAVQDGLPITVETCAHYLMFSSEEVPNGAVQYKCAPPLRSIANRELLRDAVGNGTVSIVSSDHSPAPEAIKNSGDFLEAWGGISGLQYLLPAVNTVAQVRGWPLTKLAEMLSTNPAKLIGVGTRKGALVEGFDADVVVWDPWARANTSTSGNFHKWKITPYAEMPLQGRVHMTFVDGVLVHSEEQGPYTMKLCGSPLLLPSSGSEYRKHRPEGQASLKEEL
eukprot:jgi/Ulvmu1/4303/UM002_0024.1